MIYAVFIYHLDQYRLDNIKLLEKAESFRLLLTNKQDHFLSNYISGKLGERVS